MATDKSTVITELQTTLSQIQPDIDVNKGISYVIFKYADDLRN